MPATTSGSLVPSWQHLVFEAPYNTVAIGRRINWSNWQQVELDRRRRMV
jgi:hypothetical protein